MWYSNGETSYVEASNERASHGHKPDSEEETFEDQISEQNSEIRGAETFLDTLVRAELLRDQRSRSSSGSATPSAENHSPAVSMLQRHDSSLKRTTLAQILNLHTANKTGSHDSLLDSSSSTEAKASISLFSQSHESSEQPSGASSGEKKSIFGKEGLNQSMEKVIHQCMRSTCKNHDLALGNIWVQGEGLFLVTSQDNQTFTKGVDAEIHFFGEKCREFTFQRGQGLPGLSWKTGEPVWAEDVTKLSLLEYPRLNIAKACGVHCSFCIPFNVCGTTIAVLEFVSPKPMERDEDLIEEIVFKLRDALTMKVNSGLLQKSNSQGSMCALEELENGWKDATNDTSGMSGMLRLKAVSEQWLIHRQDVTITDKLSEGQQGIVYRATWRGMPVAAKTIKISKDQKNEQDFYNEVTVLSHLRHPNLALFLGACLEDAPAFILNEYLEGGSLEQLFAKKYEERGGRPWRPPMKQVHRWSTDLARALAFLHNCDPPIIHRDLKPSNLLLSAEGSLKVSDFGLSKIVLTPMQSGTYQMTGLTGTVRYMAPEVMTCAKYNEKVDIYSYALIVWSIATGERPFESTLRRCLNAETFANAITTGDRPDTDRMILQPLSKLMKLCWLMEADKRPPATEILNHLEEMRPQLIDGKKAATRPKGQQKQCVVQ